MGHDPIRSALEGERARTLIRIKAKQLVGKAGLTRADEEDIRQQLITGVLREAHRYDAKRSAPLTFVSRVVDTEAATILRGRRRLKRGGGRTPETLDAPARCYDPDGPSRGAAIAEDHRRPSSLSPDQFHMLKMQIVRDARASLPPHLAALARELINGTPASAARALGLSRSQLSAQRKELRRHFEKFV